MKEYKDFLFDTAKELRFGENYFNTNFIRSIGQEESEEQ